MLYKKPSFSVPATEGKGDCSQGHAMPDRKGKCIRCGGPVDQEWKAAPLVWRKTGPGSYEADLYATDGR